MMNLTKAKKISCRLKSVLFILGLGFGLLFGLAPQSSAASVQAANAGREGQAMDLHKLPVRGKITVVDVFSPYCPPCMGIAPLMERLARKRSDLAIKKVNIQRPEVSGHIDWQSPLAQQLGLHSIPHFMIFDRQGKLTAQGQEATRQVIGWLKEAGILKQ
jgi:thiol-disulfide isomerase/thioredoxin